MKRQNDGLRKTVATGLPFVTYKYAMTLDGRVATDSGDSRWISSAESRALVHQWRAWCGRGGGGSRHRCAADDPRADRARRGRAAASRCAWWSTARLSLPRESALVRSVSKGRCWWSCGAEVDEARRAEVESWGVEVATVALRQPTASLDPRAVAGAAGGARECRRCCWRAARDWPGPGGPRG